jgi:aliphatic nitrilase
MHGDPIKVVKKIRDLGKQGDPVRYLPEAVVPCYPYFSFILAPLQNIAGPEQRKLLGQAVKVPSPARDVIPGPVSRRTVRGAVNIK